MNGLVINNKNEKVRGFKSMKFTKPYTEQSAEKLRQYFGLVNMSEEKGNKYLK